MIALFKHNSKTLLSLLEFWIHLTRGQMLMGFRKTGDSGIEESMTHPENARFVEREARLLFHREALLWLHFSLLLSADTQPYQGETPFHRERESDVSGFQRDKSSPSPSPLFKGFAPRTQPCVTSRDRPPPSPSLVLDPPFLPSKRSSAMSEALPGSQVLSLPLSLLWRGRGRGLWPESY